MSIEILVEDYERACKKLGIKWPDIKRAAKQAAAERQLELDSDRMKELLLANDGLDRTNPKYRDIWMKNQDEISEIFSRHDRLIMQAFPKAVNR